MRLNFYLNGQNNDVKSTIVLVPKKNILKSQEFEKNLNFKTIK